MAHPIEVLTTVPAAVPAGREHAPPTGDTEAALAGVLATVLDVGEVPVDAHFFDDLGADSMVMARFCARVRKQAGLPSVSMKDVYQHPTIAGLATAFLAEAPPALPVRDELAAVLAEVLAEVLQVERVPVDAHFFDDLGADSMVMARFCARVRKRPELPSVSMKEVYQHPTIGELAAAFAGATSAPAPAPDLVPARPAEAPRRASTVQFVWCGVLQLLIFLGYTYLGAVVLVGGFDWITAGSGVVEHYLRSVVVGGAALLGMCLLPVVVKWVLIGRWKPQEIRVWSLAYVRFWTVKTLIRANPVVLFFNGSPLYSLYLRALGARVGPGVAVFTKTVPVCTDLITIGAGTVICKDSVIAGYRAHAGMIQTGPVTLGRDVLVSEATVLDIGTSMGDGAQLGHRSALHAGQSVPAGQRWHGSPGQRTEVDYRSVPPAACGRGVRVAYSVQALLTVLLVSVPLGISGVTLLLDLFPGVAALLDTGALALTSPAFYLDAVGLSLVFFLGSLLGRLLFVVTVPRVLNRFITPDRVYRLYGLHYSIHRTIARTTNVKVLLAVFGDSSYIVGYLRALGYDLGRVLQTGSNFGVGVKQENPYLSAVGRGTMVADGLSMMNADFSSTSFRVSRTVVGADNFLGNAIAYPAQAKTGDNCLLATKVMVPIDGPVRQGVGLLGSPAFEIPRTVDRDASLQVPEADLPGHLAAKNRHNRHTIGLFLLLRWTSLFGVTLITLVGLELHDRLGPISVAVASVLSLLFTVGYGALAERAATGFHPMTPLTCSIYDQRFWRHERFWKLVANPSVFNGTPFKNLAWRLLGVRLGARVFDDGAGMPERSPVTIGDDCTLNAGSTIQCHSQEDGAFKLDAITIGSHVTIGVGAWVHYATTIGDHATLAADSFLMKGEEIPTAATWGGNPARPMSELPAPSHARPLGAGDVAEVAGGTHGRHRSNHQPLVHGSSAARHTARRSA